MKRIRFLSLKSELTNFTCSVAESATFAQLRAILGTFETFLSAFHPSQVLSFAKRETKRSYREVF